MGRLAYLNRICGKRGGRIIEVHVCILSKDAARGAEYAEPLMFDPRHKVGRGRWGGAGCDVVELGLVRQVRCGPARYEAVG